MGGEVVMSFCSEELFFVGGGALPVKRLGLLDNTD